MPDFDIVKEAGGVRRGIYKEFDINVTSSTLVIHLYWTGKGTMAIPTRGTYGPLISAISVTPSESCHDLFLSCLSLEDLFVRPSLFL